jgi:SAM-dependent methyltransferase
MNGHPAERYEPRRSFVPLSPPPLPTPHPDLPAVRAYWNARIHDEDVATSEPGTRAYFDELDAYRFEKLAYLEKLVDFPRFAGRRVLEIGCGAGTDLVRFAAAGADVIGIDIADSPLALARANGRSRSLDLPLMAADGAHLPFADEAFDFVYCHGVLPYAPEPHGIVVEAHRVLKPGGAALFMGYHRRSWLPAMSRLTRTGLEHDDAPVFRLFSADQLERAVALFAQRRILFERFPVRSRLHGGLKGVLFNTIFVPGFRALPRRLTRGLGWHLIAICQKEDGEATPEAFAADRAPGGG